MQVRLNKALADLGVCSRRAADVLIAEGQVKVNGTVVTALGTKVDPTVDQLVVREETVAKIERERVVIALNKPVGVESTSLKRPGVKILLDYIPKEVGRVFPVGRLDKDSRGLILLSNDGLFSYHLTHPSFEKEKEYLVRVAGIVTPEHLAQLRKGVQLFGINARPAEVTQLGRGVLQIVLTEGKNRQIRRMLRLLNLPVKDLQRVRIGSYRLGDLEEGQWRRLSAEEVAGLDPRITT